MMNKSEMLRFYVNFSRLDEHQNYLLLLLNEVIRNEFLVLQLLHSDNN